MSIVGCAPIHWKFESELPNCNTPDQYRKIMNLLEDVEERLPPCQSIDRLITSATSMSCNKTDKSLHLKFYFKDPVYKEINVLKAYGFESLVGNAGKIKPMLRILDLDVEIKYIIPNYSNFSPLII